MSVALRAAAPAAPAGSLPPLEALVGRVPAHLAGMLDDLFRAKFTGVRRFPAELAPEPAAGNRPAR